MQLSASQKNGIIQLAVLIALLCCFIYVKNKDAYHDFGLKLNEEEQCWIDNEKTLYAENQKEKKKYTYYVNNLNDHKGYIIGMSIQEIDRYLKYKEQGKSIHTPQDFLRVTKMELNRFDTIKNKLRFSSKKKVAPKVESPSHRKFNLNLVTPRQLLALGMSKKISYRVVNYRKHLGKYSSLDQLNKVYDITDKELKQLKSSVYLKK